MPLVEHSLHLLFSFMIGFFKLYLGLRARLNCCRNIMVSKSLTTFSWNMEYNSPVYFNPNGPYFVRKTLYSLTIWRNKNIYGTDLHILILLQCNALLIYSFHEFSWCICTFPYFSLLVLLPSTSCNHTSSSCIEWDMFTFFLRPVDGKMNCRIRWFKKEKKWHLCCIHTVAV